MQTEKAKEFATFLTSAITVYNRYIDPKIKILPNERKFQELFSISYFDEYFQAFMAEAKENIKEYQDIQIIHDYIKTQFHELVYFFTYGMGSNVPIFEKGEDVNFLLTLKRKIEVYLEKMKSLYGDGKYESVPSDSLIKLYNNTIKGFNSKDDKQELPDFPEFTETDEDLDDSAPEFDERFDFARVKETCDTISGTLRKITFIKDRLYDLRQWQVQYDEEDEEEYLYTPIYYPKFEELCNLELQRLNERLELEREYGQEITHEKESETISTGYNWEASDTDLLELVTALYKEKAIQRKDGKEITRKELLGLFEQLFGKEIKDAEGKLAKATERKMNPTVFLNKLQNAFVSYAEEKLEKKGR